MIYHLSYSSISALLRCPRSWKYRYIDKLPSAMTANLLVGNVYHKTIAYAYNQKMAGAIPGQEEIAEMFSTFWEQQVKAKYVYDGSSEPKLEATYIDWNGWEPNVLHKRGQTMSKLYVSKMLPKYDPVAVEQKFKKNIEGVPLPIVGYIDVLTEDLIVDHKWRGRAYSEMELAKDIQMTLYSMLTGRRKMEIHQALNQNKLGLRAIPLVREEAEIEWVEDLVRAVWLQIDSGIFPPNPMNNLCSPKYCPYYATCKMSWL